MLVRRTRLVAAGVLAGLVLGAACSSGAGSDGGGRAGLVACTAAPRTCNGGTPTEGGTLVYATDTGVGDWNLASAGGNAAGLRMMLGGVLPSAFVPQPDLTVELNSDLLASARQASQRPQTIVYRIRPDAIWSDGTPITVDDFVYNWKVRDGEHCPDCTATSHAGYRRIASIEGANGGKTVTVTFSRPYTDWKALFAPLYPAHIAAKHGDLSTAEGLAKAFDWFSENVPTYSAGPFKIERWRRGTALTLVPNPEWYGSGPHLDRIVFRVMTEPEQQRLALRRNEIQVMQARPHAALLERVERMPEVEHVVGASLTRESIGFNLGNTFLADEPLRDAMFVAADRQAIIAETVGERAPGTEPVSSHNLVPRQRGYRDVLPGGQGSGDMARARQILTAAGYEIRNAGGNPRLYAPRDTRVPAFTLRYPRGDRLRREICEVFAAQVAALGVRVRPQPTDRPRQTLAGGDYDIALLAPAGSPFPFRRAAALWSSDGRSNFGGYRDATVDTLVAEAAANADRREATRQLNRADRILSGDSYVLPLYQRPTLLATHERYVNIRHNPAEIGPSYNAQAWGIAQGVR